ncbi:MAG: branched-chain amino acid ABC transporter permease [Thermoleophilia bacterium]|nr:branched-chain amino acid ABC transporter permease [Thermoleophilia bacterium]
MFAFVIHTAIIFTIFLMLAVGCNFIVGYGGLFTIGHGAFYALGAYAAGLLSTKLGLGFWPGLAAGGVVAAAVGGALAISLSTVDEDYFSLATFGFGIVTFTVLMNWFSVTNGALGIAGIPAPTLFGLEIESGVPYLALVVVAAVLCYGGVWLLIRSPFGRVLQAMRDEAAGVAACGRNVVWLKSVCFAIGSFIAGVAGVLYAHYATYIDPTSFTVEVSILSLSMAVVGGLGTLAGPLLGAVVVVLAPELLRFVDLPAGSAGLIRQGIYGGLLVLTLAIRPAGLLGRRTRGG